MLAHVTVYSVEEITPFQNYTAAKPDLGAGLKGRAGLLGSEYQICRTCPTDFTKCPAEAFCSIQLNVRGRTQKGFTAYTS